MTSGAGLYGEVKEPGMILRTRLLHAAVAGFALPAGLSLPIVAAPSPPTETNAVTVVGAAGGVLQIASTGPSLDATVALWARQEPKSVTAQVGVFRSADGEAFTFRSMTDM